MKVSFLVTYYNQEKFVKQSLDSIIAINKNFDWEILVGDDGSKDNTVNIINEYINKYPKNIKLYQMPRDENKNYEIVRRASSNRLNLLENATGDYFCILDGDDFYCNTTFLDKAIKTFADNPKLSVVTFGFKYYPSNEENFNGIPKEGLIAKNIYLKKYYTHSGACVFKRCFDKDRIEFLKKIGYFDDNDIVINSLNYGDLYSINEIVYAYHQTNEGIWKSSSRLEQDILNAQGFDVEIKYLDNFNRCLETRYLECLFNLFFKRNQIHKIIDSNKLKVYIDGCSKIYNSYTYLVLNYNNLTTKNKIKTWLCFISFVLRHPIKFKRYFNHLIKRKLGFEKKE